MRGGNPHGPHTTRRTGPRQELTIGSRKRKFLVDRASTLLGKGITGNWGDAAMGRLAAPSPQGHTASQPGKVPGRQPIVPTGEGNRGRQRPARPVGLRRSSDPSCDGSNPIAAVGRPLAPLKEIRDPDHRARVALPDLYRAGAKDRVDGTTFVAELSEIGAREDGVRVPQAVGGGRAGAHDFTESCRQ